MASQPLAPGRRLAMSRQLVICPLCPNRAWREARIESGLVSCSSAKVQGERTLVCPILGGKRTTPTASGPLDIHRLHRSHRARSTPSGEKLRESVSCQQEARNRHNYNGSRGHRNLLAPNDNRYRKVGEAVSAPGSTTRAMDQQKTRFRQPRPRRQARSPTRLA